MSDIASETVTEQEIVADQARQATELPPPDQQPSSEQVDDSDNQTNDFDNGSESTPDIPESTPTPPARSYKVTPELRQQMENAYNYWHTKGYPEKAAVLYECLQQNRRPPKDLLPSEGGVTPETAVDPANVKMPPRAGPDASTDAWRAFAKKVIDMEPVIIDAMPRSDIIKILEEKGVIEKDSESPPK